MVVRLALAPWTARLTLAIVVLFPVGGALAPLPPEHAAHAAAFAGDHLDRAGQAALAGGGLLAEQVVQPGLPAQQLAVAGGPEALGGAPVGFHLRHGVSYGVRTGAGRPPGAASRSWAGVGGAWPRPAAWEAPLPPWVLRGENTVIMLRPSWRAGLSTWAISTRSVASRSSSRRPSSVWAISRPRNMMVTLTLWPCLRKRST